MTINLENDFRSLMRNHRRIVQDYLNRLDLYMGQPRVLFYLEENPNINQKELSDMLEISKETTSVSIRRLENNGFIVRKESPDDRRINLLNLSEHGLDVVKDLRLNFNEINGLMFTDLNLDETKDLKRMLGIMNTSLEKRLIDEEII